MRITNSVIGQDRTKDVPDDQLLQKGQSMQFVFYISHFTWN